mgnify:FL=1
MDKMKKFYGVICKFDDIAVPLTVLAWIWICLPFMPNIPSGVYIEIVFITLSLIFTFVAMVLIDCDNA